MSHNLQPNAVVAQVTPHFSRHCSFLKVILPSPEEPALHGDLSSRLKRFKDAMKAPSPKECDANRFYRHLLWTQAQDTGLVLSLLTALGHKATLEADASIIFELVACINPILAAGIKSNVNFSAEIIRAAAEAIPKAISACWRKPSNRICPYEAQSVTELLHLEYLVELGCLASQLVERGRDPKATVRPMEPDTLRELESRLRKSEALENLMLQFLIHRGKSSQLTTRAVASFSKIFGSGLPPLANRSPCFNNLEMTLRGILPLKDDADHVDCSRYPAIVDTVYTVLSSPQHWVYLRVDGSVLKGLGTLTLCCLLSGGYWEFVKSEENILREEELLKLSIRTLVIACSLRFSTSLFSLLAFQRAFIPLVARGLLAWQLLGDNALGDTNVPGSYDWKAVLRGRTKAIGKSLQENSKGFSDEIVTSTGFTSTLDMLRCAKRLKSDATQSADQPIHIWKEFCGIGQLDEQTYRQERRRVGCAWVRCPLYGTETFAKEDDLVCTECEAVAYCGELCQERDWERHDRECKELRNECRQAQSMPLSQTE